LTAPPCSEGIIWTILADIQSISAKQLLRFQNKWAADPSFAEGRGNNRKVQNLNDREVFYTTKDVPTPVEE
jgi:carbonic anhydrase